MARVVKTPWTFFLEDAHGRVLVFGALCALTLWLSLRDFYSYQFGYQPDSVEYTLLAHSLAQGSVFGLDYRPDAPAPTHYPFGFPLLLIPFVLVAPTDFALPQWLSLVATLVSAGILYWGWRTLVPMYGNGWRIAVTAMFLLAPTTLLHTRVVLSEPSFTALVLLALWFGARLARTPRRHDLWFAFSIACFFMVFVRSIGWLFMASFLFYLGIALRRDIARGLLLFAATFLTLLGVILALTPVTPANLIPAQYAAWLIEYGPINPSGERIGRNRPTPVPLFAVPTTVAAAPATPTPNAAPTATNATVLDFNFVLIHIHEDLRRLLLLSGGGNWEQNIAARLNLPGLLLLPGLCSLLLVIWGNFIWVRDTRRAYKFPISLFQFSMFAHLAIAFIWRGGGERLFYPIQPQLYLTLFLAVGVLAAAVGRVMSRLHITPFQKTAPRVNWLLAVGVTAWLTLAVYRDLTLRTSYEAWGDLRQRTEWIQANTPPDAILLSDWATYDYLMTGRRGFEFPAVSDPAAQVPTLIENQRVDYVVVAIDDSFRTRGISPFGLRVFAASAGLQAMLKTGKLVRVYSNSFPIQVLRVAP